MSQPELFESPNLPERSNRWHFDWQGRRFIVYADTQMSAAGQVSLFTKRDKAAILSLSASGYYDRATNTIVGALDGPHTVYENWSKGRKL